MTQRGAAQTLAGSVAPRISDNNSPWNEWFNMTQEQYRMLRTTNPELFDPQLSARDRAQKWREFGQTTAGRALRIR